VFGLFCADVPLRNYSLTHSLCLPRMSETIKLCHCSLCYRNVIVVSFSLVKMVFGFSSRSNSVPTWHELQHAILRNFGGSDDVKPVEVFARHLWQIDKDALVCPILLLCISCTSAISILETK